MNRSRALIKLASVALATAGAIAAATAQQAPAKAPPDWNAPAGTPPGPATTAAGKMAPRALPAVQAVAPPAFKMERSGQAEAMKQGRKREGGQPAAPAAREGAR
jgi:hypothetical protein